MPRQRQSYQPSTPTHATSRPTSRNRRALLLPTVLCGAALLAGAASLGAVAVGSSHTTTHAFRLPQHAGSLTRDRSAEDAMATRLSSAERGFGLQFGSRLRSVTSGVYRDGSATTDPSAAELVFVGAAVDTSGRPEDFVTAFRTAARRAGYTVRTVSAGAGAQGVCMASRDVAATCAWSTGDSVGEVVPAGTGWDVDHLAVAMRALRAGAEHLR